MSRGHVPRVDGEGSLGRSDKRWGEVRGVNIHADTLFVNGAEFDADGATVPAVTDMGANVDIDFAEDFHSAAPTADATFTTSNVTDARRVSLLVQGDSGEYTIAFPAGIKWKTRYPNQLVDGVDFLFEFVTYGGEIYGSFAGTFKTEIIRVTAKGVANAAVAAVESLVIEERQQLHSIGFSVDQGSENTLEFDTKLSSSSIYTGALPSIPTGSLTSRGAPTETLDRTKRVLEVGDVLEFDVVEEGSPTVSEGLKIRVTSLIL